MPGGNDAWTEPAEIETWCEAKRGLGETGVAESRPCKSM
jgi:hypothetical protein